MYNIVKQVIIMSLNSTIVLFREAGTPLWGVVSNARGYRSESSALTAAYAVGDAEGIALKTAVVSSCALDAVSSGMNLTGVIIQAESGVTALSSTLSLVGSIFTGVASLIGMGVCTYRLWNLYKFRQILNSENNSSAAPEEKAKRLLEKFHEMLSLTEEEKERIATQVKQQNPQASEEDVQKKYTDAILVKEQKFKRQSSAKSVLLVRSQAEEVLTNLSSTDLSVKEQATQCAQELIGSIQTANTKKTLYFSFALLLWALTFTAVVASFILSAGIIPLALTIIASVITVAMIAIHKLVGWLEERAAVSQALQKIKPETPGNTIYQN